MSKNVQNVVAQQPLFQAQTSTLSMRHHAQRSLAPAWNICIKTPSSGENLSLSNLLTITYSTDQQSHSLCPLAQLVKPREDAMKPFPSSSHNTPITQEECRDMFFPRVLTRQSLMNFPHATTSPSSSPSSVAKKPTDMQLTLLSLTAPKTSDSDSDSPSEPLTPSMALSPPPSDSLPLSLGLSPSRISSRETSSPISQEDMDILSQFPNFGRDRLQEKYEALSSEIGHEKFLALMEEMKE